MWSPMASFLFNIEHHVDSTVNNIDSVQFTQWLSEVAQHCGSRIELPHLSADYCLLPWWISYWTGQIGQRAICELRHVITSLFNKLTVQYSKSKSSKLKSKFWVHNAGLFWHIEVESFSGTHDRINCKFCCCSVFKFLRDLVSLLFWGVYWIGVPRGLP